MSISGASPAGAFLRGYPAPIVRSATRRVLARKDLLRFVRLLFPAYEVEAIHRRIAAFLEDAERTPGFRGVLTLPPRAGKSELASVNFPAWLLGRNPDWQIIAASHSAQLAYDFSRQARNKFLDPDWPFVGIGLSADSKNVGQWNVQIAGKRTRGRYVAVGVGGSPTGKGADILLIDDAVASQADADSPVVRESTWQWFRGTVIPRLQPAGRVVVIGTRWHYDDLIGRILNEASAEPGRWRVLHVPAIGPDGASFSPSRWPAAELAQKRRDVGERVWNAQYMGVPAPEEGALLKASWFPRFDRLPEGILYLIQSWDTAFKDGTRNDFSVCHTYAVTVYGLFLVGRWKGRVEFPELVRAAKDQFGEWKPRHVLIEDKASGTSLGQTLHRETAIPVVMVPVPNTRDGKVQRVHEITPHLEAQRVKVPGYAPWVDDVIAEWTAFPLGAFDDEVDVMSQAVARVFGTVAAGTVKSSSYLPEPEEEEGERW